MLQYFSNELCKGRENLRHTLTCAISMYFERWNKNFIKVKFFFLGYGPASHSIVDDDANSCDQRWRSRRWWRRRGHFHPRLASFCNHRWHYRSGTNSVGFIRHLQKTKVIEFGRFSFFFFFVYQTTPTRITVQYCGLNNSHCWKEMLRQVNRRKICASFVIKNLFAVWQMLKVIIE